MTTTTNKLPQTISFLQNIISRGGPETIEYDELNRIFDDLSCDYKAGKISGQALHLLQEGFGDECLENTLHGHIKSKPYGYAGDFMIIDKIYQEQLTSDERFVKWDIFWNNQSAAKAVRNRKDYFLQTMTNRLKQNPSMRLLDVASGPARDLAELYKMTGQEQLQTVCVEADASAITYAKELNSANAASIEFVHKNIFRFNAVGCFDIVWSAGLFDYFDDSIFVKLLRKFISWTNRGGEVIIGNFGEGNPSRNYMEIVGEWYLIHRSAEHLTGLAMEAGAKLEDISVGSELEGVNLFLHVRVD